MDRSSVLGIFIGLTAIIWAVTSDGDWRLFVDWPSLVIVLGGTIAATLISHPMEQIARVPMLVRVAFSQRRQTAADVIPLMVHFAEKARREGLLAMEEEAEALEDPFLRKGIQLAVDGVDPEIVRNVLETEIDFLSERHAAGRAVFQTAGNFAPAFGMLGTLVGLIRMLAYLENPDQIGSGLAVALITTFYGAVLANLVFLPIAGKLQVKSSQELLVKALVVEGILAIQAGDNPRIVEEKLRAFLSRAPQGRGPSPADEGVRSSHAA
ncbi:MAG: flagellar motor protein MotP [Firmicutes bacterium ZCTH02-B6]|nr:MAG: flagellar motor protein MotP [Firmicutes bacterium ZCTH02-B6]